jgi:hypothetical protein
LNELIEGGMMESLIGEDFQGFFLVYLQKHN